MPVINTKGTSYTKRTYLNSIAILAQKDKTKPYSCKTIKSTMTHASISNGGLPKDNLMDKQHIAGTCYSVPCESEGKEWSESHKLSEVT